MKVGNHYNIKHFQNGVVGGPVSHYGEEDNRNVDLDIRIDIVPQDPPVRPRLEQRKALWAWLVARGEHALYGIKIHEHNAELTNAYPWSP